MDKTLPSVLGKQLLACHLQASTSRSTSALLRFSFRIELFHDHTGRFSWLQGVTYSCISTAAALLSGSPRLLYFSV